MNLTRIAAALAVLSGLATARATVVINEIFYHAPSGLEDVQWIELYNDGDQPLDLSGWFFDKGLSYTLPKGTTIAAHGYVIVARNPQHFQQLYSLPAVGPFKQPLSRSGAHIVLCNAKGKRVDEVRYKDQAPWPVGADGSSASLERICPSAPGELAENWAGAPLPATFKPAGTPGKQNANYCATLPPVIDKVTGQVDELATGQALSVQAQVKDSQPPKEVILLWRAVTGSIEGKESAIPMARNASGLYAASIPGQSAHTLLRYRIKAVGTSGAQRFYPAENDLRPALSTYVHDKWDMGKLSICAVINVLPSQTAETTKPTTPGGQRYRPMRFGPFGGPGNGEAHTPRGSVAFLYVDQKTGKSTLIDFVSYVPTGNLRAHKVFFTKEKDLQGMRAIKLLARPSERQMLAEELSFELYRRAGSIVPHTEFVRVYADGRLEGPRLLLEQANKSFLARLGLRTDGNLYKLVWFGSGITGQHVKKTNLTTGHEDLIAVVNQLNKTKGEEQWQVIEKNFNVPQFINCFAVAMITSDWDGFFNNYETYHDLNGSGQWHIYPFDKEKTWGFYDGVGHDEVFFDMPLTFGMEGDASSGRRSTGILGALFGGGDNGFGGGSNWWRPGGYFSKPMLANPQFRKLYLARIRQLLETVYTKDTFFPVIDEVAGRLREELAERAKSQGERLPEANQRLDHAVDLLRQHLIKRREFLLAQEEMRSGQPTTRP